MSNKLTYPGLSVVFIQTFSIHHTKEFVMPAEVINNDTQEEDLKKGEDGKIYYELADSTESPIVEVKKRDIEQLIFSLPKNSPYESERRIEKRLFRKPRVIPKKGNIRRYSLRGFEFTMPIKENKDEDITRAELSGHCNVEMNLFCGHVVSITYRFLFDGLRCFLDKPIDTDHIIIFLSSWLNAEHWSPDEDEKGITTIEYPTHIKVNKIWFNKDGDAIEDPIEYDIQEKGRSFDDIALRYKKYIFKHCTQFKRNISRTEQKDWVKKWAKQPLDVGTDLRYAMVDIWENLQHLGAKGSDLFRKKEDGGKLDESQIIDHIRNKHKSELVGLLSLYPAEWIYRSPEAYDDICGENIAIDTDDLVLAGTSLCVVIGTYGRRSYWETHLKERAHYHVSWPEYLLILQMILAKKYVIGLATDEMIESTFNMEQLGEEEALIKENAELSIRLNRLVIQLDILKYARYPAHKVMYNRTSKRLGLDEDYQRLMTIMDNVDNSMHNISDYRSLRSDYLLNIILAIISIASTFELLYQQSELPFIKHILGWEHSGSLASWLVAVVAAVAIFSIGYVFTHFLKIVISKKHNKRHD